MTCRILYYISYTSVLPVSTWHYMAAQGKIYCVIENLRNITKNSSMLMSVLRVFITKILGTFLRVHVSRCTLSQSCSWSFHFTLCLFCYSHPRAPPCSALSVCACLLSPRPSSRERSSTRRRATCCSPSTTRPYCTTANCPPASPSRTTPAPPTPSSAWSPPPRTTPPFLSIRLTHSCCR